MRWLGIVLLGLVGYPIRAQQPCTFFRDLLVVGGADQSPLPGAVIHLHYPDGTEVVLLTDNSGRVEIPLCGGPFLLHLDYLGYQSRDLPIGKAEDLPAAIGLEEAALSAPETEVTASRTTAKPSLAESQLEGTSLAEAQGGTLADALKQLPGVSSLSTGPTIAKPVVHGHQGTRVVLLNNGVRQEAQQWGSEHGPEVDPFLASRLTVVTGPAALQYGGDAIGGVVTVEPPELPGSPGLGGLFHAVGMTNGRLTAVSGQLEGGFGAVPGAAWRVQGTYRRAGDLKTPSYYLNNTGLSEANFSLATGYRSSNWQAEVFYSRFASQLGILEAAHIGNLTDLRLSIVQGAPLASHGYRRNIERPFQEIDHQLLKAHAVHVVGPRGTVRLVYSWQRNARAEYDLHRQSQADVPALSFTLNTHQLEVAFSASDYPLRRGVFRYTAGLGGLRQHNTWEGRYLIPFYIRYGIGGYAHAHWTLGRSQLAAGSRIDYQQLTPKFNTDGVVRERTHRFLPVSGGLNWTYALTPRISVEAGMGWAARTPYVNELHSDGVHHGSGTYELGDSTLGLEQAWKTAVALLLEPAGKMPGVLRTLEVQIRLYRDQVQDYIVLEALPEPQLTIRGAFPAFRSSQSDVTFAGADLALAFQLAHGLRYSLRASWVRSRDAETTYAAPFTPADRYQQSLRYSFSVGRKHLSAYAELSALALDRAQGFAPTEGLPVATPEFVVVARDYAPPPPGYLLWGAAVGIAVPVCASYRVECRLSIENALDTSYRDYLDRFRYFVHAPGRNVRLQLRIPVGRLTASDPQG